MKVKDVVIGLIVLAVLVTAALFYKRSRSNTSKTPTPSPNYQQVESQFPGLKVPENANRISLENTAGESGVGEAWRTFENGTFNLTVIANLPNGSYQASLESGDSKILLGSLKLQKGGYILNYSSTKDLTSFTKVVVSSGETNVLEGSF